MSPPAPTSSRRRPTFGGVKTCLVWSGLVWSSLVVVVVAVVVVVVVVAPPAARKRVRSKRVFSIIP